MNRLDATTYQTSHGHLEVIVGDEKQAKFFPRVKLKAWDNEANFSVGLMEHTGQHKLKGSQVHYGTDDLQAEFYPKKIAELTNYHQDERHGFEFSITLDQKPRDNILKLSIRTKALTFHYQPPLSAEEAKDSVRPDNVIGSYAVYHESKSNSEYKTGKAFHIYRPWAEDSTKKRVWCDLNIPTDIEGRATKDYLTITVPQDFLDSASYPVLIDPTFGYTAAGGSSTSVGNKIAVLSSQTSVTGTMTAIQSYMSVDATGSTVKTQWALYRSADITLTSLSLEATTTTSLSAQVYGGFDVGPIVTATDYDIAVWSNLPTASEHANIFYDTLTNAGKNLASTYATNSLPATLAGYSTDNNRYSLYALYSPSTILRVTSQDASATSATTSVTATYPNTPTQNNLLVAAVFSNKPTGTNVLSGWSLIQEAPTATANGQAVSVFAKFAGASESTSVTATAATATTMKIAIYEYSGAFLATASTVTGLAETIAHTDFIASGTGGSATNTSVTVAASADLLFAACGFAAGSTTSQSWSGNSFTTLLSESGRLTTAERIVTNTSSTSYTASLTWTTSRSSGVIVIAFKCAPAKPISMLGAG